MRSRMNTPRALAAVLVLAVATPLIAQDVAPLQVVQDKPAAPSANVVALQVQVVVARYQGEKRLSAMPYTLSMNSSPGSKANMRMNGEVPVPTQAFSSGASPAPQVPFSYRSLGTSIDLTAVASTPGKFGLSITVSEASLRAQDSTASSREFRELPLKDQPIFENYQSSNTIHVRDGETTQFTASTNRLTGEAVRVEVMVKVVK